MGNVLRSLVGANVGLARGDNKRRRRGITDTHVLIDYSRKISGFQTEKYFWTKV
jgi:hypothetical protein